MCNSITSYNDGDGVIMGGIKCDNVFNTEVTQDVVVIRAGICDEETLRKPNIVDEDVSEQKLITIKAEDFKGFIDLVVSAGIHLQKEYGVDVGFNLEENNSNG